MAGKVIKALSGFYYVDCKNTVFECKARGNLHREENSILVGDMVDITEIDSKHAVVESVKERKNCLLRPAVANVDCLVIVSSFCVPSPDALMIDRLSALAVFNNIEPIIVFNKCDLGDFSEWKDIYLKSGFKVYVVSAENGEGLEELKNAIKGKVCAFSGNSGVGKSSIINALFQGCNIKTADVSQKLGRGRHTTRHTEIYGNEQDGYIVDTPGFSSISSSDNYAFKEALAECFPEFMQVLESCKFTSCTHTCENGCAVLKAVESGEISQSRHKSYKIIFDELKDLKPWQNKK